MKSIYFFLLTMVFSFTSLACEAKDITKVPPQKVVHVLQQVGDYDGTPTHVIILKDGSAWRTISIDEIPAEGDVIKSSDGSLFTNTNGFEHYFFENIGTIIYTPLKIEKALTMPYPDLLKDTDEEFRQHINESFEQSNLKLFYLSNQLIYADCAFCDDDFEGWETAESIRLIRPEETKEREYLVYLEKKEIRRVESLVYSTTKLLDVDPENLNFLVKGDERAWYTLSSFVEIVAKWDPSHKICVHLCPELSKVREDEGVELIDTVEELHVPALFLRHQHGIPLTKTILNTWNLRSGIIMNLNTQEVITVWDWIPSDTQD